MRAVLRTPNRLTIVAGAAAGQHKLTAFDGALLRAGIGNLNLVRISSILPPGCQFTEGRRDRRLDGQIDIPAGSLTPTAYGAMMSDQTGETVAAAVAVGFSKDDYGVIMEFSGAVTAAAARSRVDDMVREAFSMRGIDLHDIKGAAAEIVVPDGAAAAAVAAAVLWYA